jgi:hypothetical protein
MKKDVLQIKLNPLFSGEMACYVFSIIITIILVCSFAMLIFVEP